MAGDSNGPGECAVVVGTGKQCGITLTRDDGVMLSPSAYLALTHWAPPIWRVLSWPLPTVETCAIADAPADGEATSQQSVKAAECVPVKLVAAPRSAKRVPAAIEAPTMPTATTDSQGAESDNDIYVTTRTSHVCDESIALDKNGEPVLAQYIVNDHVSEMPMASSKRKRTRHKSKGKRKAKELDVSNSTESKSTANHEGLTWDEEVCHANGEDTLTELYEDLPDVSGWVNPNWSWSDYIPTGTKHSTEMDRESVEVNAVIYKVDENYMFDDEEYAAVLRDLHEQDRSAESTHSQTSGAGPSHSHKSSDGSNDSTYMHTSISEGSDGLSDPSDSDPESSNNMRTNSLG
ncbi:hypothetical protein FRC11_005832 [Ceratobasidium sp. 423]|nr:hypothetical protein FRC11_005832 [Ceratobasidium sp. 423]